MANVKKFMQQVHRGSSTDNTNEVIAPKIKDSVNQESKMEPPKQKKITTVLPKEKPKNKVAHDVSTPIQQIARDDITLERYGVNPWKSNFNIYNKDIVNFVRNFSTENQLNGGSAITKSQMMEVILDVVFYDMELTPEGFQSADELRKYLQEKLR